MRLPVFFYLFVSDLTQLRKVTDQFSWQSASHAVGCGEFQSPDTGLVRKTHGIIGAQKHAATLQLPSRLVNN